MPAQQRLRLFVEQAKDYGIIILDEAGMILDWSVGALQLTGWTAEEAIGQPGAIIFTPEDQAARMPERELETARREGQAPDVRWHLRKDGSRFFVDGTTFAVYNDTGLAIGFGKILIDITQRKRLAEESEWQASLLELSHDAVIAWDYASGGIVYWNRAAEALYGYAASEAIGHSCSGLLKARFPESHEACRAALSRHGEWQGLLSHATRAGRRIRVDSRMVLRSDRSGQPIVLEANRDVTAELHAQERLQQSEERFRSLVTATTQIVWLAGADGRSSTDSPSWQRFTGQSWEQCRDYGWLDALPAEERARVATLWRQCIAERRVYENEHEVRRHDGQYRWMAVRGVPIVDADGSVREWIGTATDITERKRNELALYEARMRLEATLNAAEVATWIYDIPANRVIADRNLQTLFGVSTAAADGGVPLEAFTRAIHPDDLAEVNRRLDEAIRSGSSYEAAYRVRRADGAWRHVIARGRAEYATDGRALRLPGVVLDVSEQRRVEQRLRSSEERFRSLITSMDEAYCTIEVIADDMGRPLDYRFLETNPAFELQSGLSNAPGKTITDLVPTIERHWIELYGRVAATGEPIRTVQHAASMGRWFDVYATRLGGSDSRSVALLFKDITAQKRAQDALRQLAADLSRANHRQSEFLATLAHELRNPLAPIRTGLDLMAVSEGKPETIVRMRDMIGRQVDHLVHLVDDLLDVARISSGKIQLRKAPVQIAEIIAHAAEASMPVIEAKHHALVVDVPDEALWLNADQNRIVQVISNLLTNAAKYTPDGGHIALTVRQEEQEAVISVSDNGMGIPPSDLGTLFEIFTQVGRNMHQAQGGLGIGLSLVRQLTEKHGGSVSAASAGPGQGSVFTVRLPLAPGGHIDTQPRHDAYPAQERQMRILLADDNRDAAATIAELLRAMGHTVEVVNDGQQALGSLQRFDPDIALVDIGMPVMNGYEFARAARALQREEKTILVALTGWGDADARKRSREAGFDHHLTKPIDIAMLRSLLSG
ncbi:PAS domain S-box protein [Noviherbaspirillum pedocola]|uniref:histidine kinase n=1 Tax=Noviherbaspirillum pedocola TaxID=2801341 RepID=A0A934SVH0_9BURK|nr:PAS domain S-box protein [Noviherbaspirillum pedocola]MBK4737566.1 PAS domain S-box protein [Noviherbaspirillum pedocola]